MSTWAAVAIGGALGSMARHGVNRVVLHQWPLARLPWATIAVNIIGCAIIGTLAGLIATGRLTMRASWREFVFVGILGGFTTFSTFGLDTMTLIRNGDMTAAVTNVAIQMIVGIGAVYVGMRLAEAF